MNEIVLITARNSAALPNNILSHGCIKRSWQINLCHGAAYVIPADHEWDMMNQEHVMHCHELIMQRQGRLPHPQEGILLT